MKAKAGGEHTLVETKDGNIYSAGACGLGWCRELPFAKDLFGFRPVPFSRQQSTLKLKSFHASYYHNLAVSQDGKTVYAWGCGTFPEGGLDGVIPALGPAAKNSDRGEPPRPVPLAEDEVVKDITGGAYHSAILTESGKVLTFGAGQLGQLGRPAGMVDASGLPVDSDVKQAIFDKPDKIDKIGAGFYNTFAICQSGKLFCTGENQNEQCGVGVKNLQQLTRVDEIQDQVDQVEGGYCHTLVKMLDGKVWSMGCGEEGQRGDGKTDDENEQNPRAVATRVPLPKGVTAQQVAAGANHSLVLGSNGVAYGFGANDVGQCGVKSTVQENLEEVDEGDPILAPLPISLPAANNTDPVTSVSAGYAHSVLTTKQGHVFVFGQNDNGQLGLGAASSSTSANNDVGGEKDAEPQLFPVQVYLPS
mmetsp:Transcript_28349/g.46920  ORF Transcript_28349/g.46920 Transcript_28349/m.46920 type:complete len:418 (-) Transcript_28349:12-1265(-)|eukprot:CAMPEP_0119008040 /NCGR_PEP_ID=MMETSP1176-20130426/3423_1 /TAXON_ID=265551 /ORGANISM="Synedropsis recta cf, Strain CCMP1620" /LENGTH=417 /DNA_ID=CAMNT_0006960297 /DNA_START=35 /DNA_END=1288 /DNA_ORIENTATION=+